MRKLGNWVPRNWAYGRAWLRQTSNSADVTLQVVGPPCVSNRFLPPPGGSLETSLAFVFLFEIMLESYALIR